MTPPIKVIVSVDTEEDNWRAASRGLSVSNVRELPALDRFFAGLGVRPTYFTNYQVLIRPWAADMLRGFHRDGRSEIAAHLHPWNTPPCTDGGAAHGTILRDYPPSVQEAMIREVTARLEDITGGPPLSFRAGRFGLGVATVAALIRVGYRVDSSVTPFTSWVVDGDGGPDYFGAPLEAYHLDGRGDVRVPVPPGAGTLVELPLSAGYTRFPVSRWDEVGRWLSHPRVLALHLPGVAARSGLVRHAILTPEVHTTPQLTALSRQIIRSGVGHLHLFFHATSLQPGLSPFTASRADVRRMLDRIARWIDQVGRLAPIEFATVGEAAGAATAGPVVRPEVPSAPPKRPSVLVVNYHFPPDGSVGGLRWAGMTKYLSRAGWEVHVVTSAVSPALWEGVRAHTVRRRRTLNDLYNAVARAVRGRGAPSGSPRLGVPVAGPSPEPRSFLGAVRQELAALLSYPDESRGWLFATARRMRGLIRRFEPDVVVSSGPPHSAHLAALAAVAGSSRPLVVDFRDPWTMQSEAWADHPIYSSRLSKFLAPRLEKRLLARARHVIANTARLATLFREKYPDARVTWIRNGYDPERLTRARPAPYPGFSLAYAGTLYGARDLRPVLRALRRFLDANPRGPAEVRLRIAGNVERRQHTEMGETIRSLGLEPYVEVLGLVSGDEALDVLLRSTVSIVLAQKQG
ncbi:MAG TPA: glycosyltransferase, partial [Gemmatimonadales bacterium]|nr:glycosyltransferase [Gemmatimonadales bacterium]